MYKFESTRLRLVILGYFEYLTETVFPYCEPM